MKRLWLFLIGLFFFTGCSLDDGDGSNFHYEILPIESVSVPDAFMLGEIYEISMAYLRPTNCHFFNDIYYVTEGNTRTVAVISQITENTSCEQSDDELIATFNFRAVNSGTITFKFWQGQDENEVDQYLEVTVPITE